MISLRAEDSHSGSFMMYRVYKTPLLLMTTSHKEPGHQQLRQYRNVRIRSALPNKSAPLWVCKLSQNTAVPPPQNRSAKKCPSDGRF